MVCGHGAFSRLKKYIVKLCCNPIILAALMGQASPGWSQESPAPEVIVTGAQTDTEARRDFVAGKIIIGRKRIDASGVQTVAELLKREPAVTSSGDGRIGLLNMPGYTQILVDGQPPIGSDDVRVFDLARVEKIEIVKSSVAEFGPFGIAGTINIVTRTAARKTSSEAIVGLNNEHGKTSASATLSRNESTAGSPLRSNYFLSANHAITRRERAFRQTLTAPGQAPQDQSQAAISTNSPENSIIASSSFIWQRDADETVTVSPDLYSSRGTSRERERRQWTDGSALDARQEQRSTLTMLALPVKWIFRPSKKSRVELSARAHQSRFDTDQDRSERISAQTPALRQEAQQRHRQGTSVELVYKTRIEGGHDVKLGSSLSRTGEDIDYTYRLDGMPDSALQALGTHRRTSHRKTGVYLQDEWRASEIVALSVGVSGAASDLMVREGAYDGQARYLLWSPSFHASRKIGDDDKRQFRVSLARSYKAPEIDSFTLRPAINRLAPCPASGQCGANTIDTADAAGNLGLRPEKALALNLSYEHGIGDDSQITVELFTRRIAGKFGTDISLEAVPWAGPARYVARPANLGNAHSTGLDVEFELALRDLSDTAPKVNVRGSVGFASSRVANVPGPYNRLDKQTPWTAKLGASYAVPNLPLKLDFDANWSPSVWVRSSVTERISIGRRFDLDASSSWTISKAQRLVFGIKSVFPRVNDGIDDYFVGNQQIRIETASKRYASVSLRFESTL